MQTAVCHEAQL